MIIRKAINFNCLHIVRKCSSNRCKKSMHGHSYKVEVFLKSNGLDNGMMVYDFGLLGSVKELVKKFNGSYVVWNKESEEFKTFLNRTMDKIIELPVSPSAECFSIVFFRLIKEILENTSFLNGEDNIKLHSVRVHETKTGYAECFEDDESIINFNIDDIKFNKGY